MPRIGAEPLRKGYPTTFCPALKGFMFYSKPSTGQHGASLTEYALLVALIALMSLIGVRSLGQGISKKFSDVGRTIETGCAPGGGPGCDGGQGGGT